MQQKSTLVVIAGPTAVGKTAVSIQLAKHFNAEIISADSRQFYREISIGTAKPNADQLSQVKHYMINSLSITDDYNVGVYETEVVQLLNDLFQKQSIVFMVGGSGLFIDAVCNGMDQLPDVSEEVKKQVRENYDKQGIEYLQQKLQQLDPEYYAVVDINNPQRMSRAVEVCISSGKTFTSFRKGGKVHRPWQTIKIGIEMEREQLYANINKRVEEMTQEGLLDEAKKMIPYKHLNSLQTVGYSELFDHLDGKTSLEEAVNLIKQHTRNYAKRQLTWFRRDADMKWFLPTEIERVILYINENIK